jgi:hypothetical protein
MTPAMDKITISFGSPLAPLTIISMIAGMPLACENSEVFTFRPALAERVLIRGSSTG